MKITISFYFLLLSTICGAQTDLRAETDSLIKEGKRLYRSEMASWYGTDLFVAAYKQRENIGGYFSYTEGDVSKCVFFSKNMVPNVIGTISFDSTYNTDKALVDLTERTFSSQERELYTIRKRALEEINSDTLFERYSNTNLNLIPLINGSEKKVYVLTGPQKNGVVILGNDYLITFDNDNQVLTKRQLHNNIIPIPFGDDSEDKDIVGTMHNHQPETGDLITATDICTLMLYGKFTKWKQHNVISAKYLNIWNCQDNRLTVIPIPRDGEKK